MEAIERIAAERQKQKSKWSDEYDDIHDEGELSAIAAALALGGTFDPWGLLEKHKDNRNQQLVIAGTLIVAEIEHLERAK